MHTNDKLLIVWSSGELEVAQKLVLLYGSVILERQYWDEAHLMVWGPSIKLLCETKALQTQLKTVQQSGVTVSACIVCSDEYGCSDQLRAMGIDVTHTGEFLTKALKSDWKTVTF
ncbi:MAG TPA: DsrE family protein [Helicobacteraceae bacterium]|nr:DsrE family protein [Helicobacteraceae bacterium]